MKKRYILLSIGIMLCLVLVYISSKGEDSNYDTGEQFIVEELELGYLDFFKIYSSDSIDNVELFQFAFSKNNDAYIGFVAFFHEDDKNKIYEKDNLIYIDYDFIKGEYPFSLYTFTFNVPGKFQSVENKSSSYQYYYGCINDEKISEIAFEFSNEYIHIMPVAGKYYTLGIKSREDLLCVKGLDKELDTVSEYSYLGQ